ncbi:hypothetical protein BD289DRAFT_212099 [Coniella lustricola]|uniref:Uncharacterized protein n=1 Tax=Coniella lustricola TaxID=2025994 RepID=A0A2T3ABL1_9PEZI|nr:hypothetical protein BD289DRAFT_212099 [Coniella lustricola]
MLDLSILFSTFTFTFTLSSLHTVTLLLTFAPSRSLRLSSRLRLQEPKCVDPVFATCVLSRFRSRTYLRAGVQDRQTAPLNADPPRDRPVWTASRLSALSIPLRQRALRRR